ncbi:MAG: hypothetical protein K2Z81_04375, partial [Cyanobacteria bacterium]|nr:hypothetical protein [Cyanobacteriota bacterium]
MAKVRKPNSSDGGADNDRNVRLPDGFRDDDQEELGGDDDPRIMKRSSDSYSQPSPVRMPKTRAGGSAAGMAASSAEVKEKKQRPTADDFRTQAVEKAVLNESLKNPATIYPLCASILGTIWSVAQTSELSVAVSLGLAFVSASAFIYNFVVKGPEKAANHVAKLRAQ